MALEDILSGQRDDVTPWLNRFLGRESLPATHGAIDSIGAGLRYLRDLARPTPDPGTELPAGNGNTIGARYSPASPALAAPAPAPARRPGRPALAPAPTPTAELPAGNGNTIGASYFPTSEAPVGPASPALDAPAQTPRQSYADEFKALMAQKQAELKAPLTDEQRKNLELQFFLGLLAQPRGTGLLEGVGKSGQGTIAAKQAQEKENLTRAEKDRANQMDMAYKTLMLQDRDEGNQLRGRELDISERMRGRQLDISAQQLAGQIDRWTQEGRNEAERLALLRDQAKKSSWDEIKTSKGIYFIDKSTGTLQMALDPKGNPLMPHDPVDRRPEAAKIFDLSKRDPQFKEFYDKTQAKREGSITEKDLFTVWGNIMKERVPAEQQPFDAWVSGIRGGTGQPVAGMVQDGYRFKGGDPSKRGNWEKVK